MGGFSHVYRDGITFLKGVDSREIFIKFHSKGDLFRCCSRHRWELLGNYPVFTVVMVIYRYIEIISIILVTSNFLYKMYDHEKNYPDKPVDIHIQSLININ